MRPLRPARRLFAAALLGAFFSASLGVAQAADGTDVDPMAEYIALIDDVRAVDDTGSRSSSSC